MLKKTLLYVLALFLIGNLLSCIPIKTVKSIPTYKIVKAKMHSKKEYKKYTKFVFLNNKRSSNFIHFLEEKFKVFKHKGRVYITDRIIKSSNKNFNLTVYFKVNESKYISLINLFSKNRRDSFDAYYDPDIDEPVQTSGVYNYVEITVTDDGKVDYLNSDSEFKNELYTFLNNLRMEYNLYLNQNLFN